MQGQYCHDIMTLSVKATKVAPKSRLCWNILKISLQTRLQAGSWVNISFSAYPNPESGLPQISMQILA